MGWQELTRRFNTWTGENRKAVALKRKFEECARKKIPQALQLSNMLSRSSSSLSPTNNGTSNETSSPLSSTQASFLPSSLWKETMSDFAFRSTTLEECVERLEAQWKAQQEQQTLRDQEIRVQLQAVQTEVDYIRQEQEKLKTIVTQELLSNRNGFL